MKASIVFHNISTLNTQLFKSILLETIRQLSPELALEFNTTSNTHNTLIYTILTPSIIVTHTKISVNLLYLCTEFLKENKTLKN